MIITKQQHQNRPEPSPNAMPQEIQTQHKTTQKKQQNLQLPLFAPGILPPRAAYTLTLAPLLEIGRAHV